MKHKRFRKLTFSIKSLTILPLAILILSVSFTNAQMQNKLESTAQPNAVFTNSTPIIITDATEAGDPDTPNPSNPYPSVITVSGLSGTIPLTPGSIKVTINRLTHPFPKDLGMVLVGPTGAALLLQDAVGAGNAVTSLPYSISDSGTEFMPLDSVLQAKVYKPTGYFTGDPFMAPGPGVNYAHPGPVGGNTATFASVFGGTNPNGDWKLFVLDYEAGDTGRIEGGWTLEINTSGGGTQPTFKNRLDYFGNGYSDWATLNAESDYLIWKIARNDIPTPSAPGAARIMRIPFGSLTRDYDDRALTQNVPAFGDYTGDGKTDIIVWRKDAQSVYWLLRSEDSTATAIPWGTTGDLPGAEGDYDGDGKMDPTVLRSENGALRWYVLRSATNTFSTFVFGTAGTDIPLPGTDYTGDGIDDPTVARIDSSTKNIYWITGNTSGQLIKYVGWGDYDTDYIVPGGDYDGDGKADHAIWRGYVNSQSGIWYILKSAGGIDYVPWGLPGVDPDQTTSNPNRDIPLRSGDYDGDKKTDIAVYRRSNNTFYVYRSSDKGLMSQKWQDPGDVPVAAFGIY